MIRFIRALAALLAAGVMFAAHGAPAGTPAAIVEQLNAEITAALDDSEIKAGMRNLGVEPAPSKAAEFEAYIKSETQKWGKVIKAAGIKIQ